MLRFFSLLACGLLLAGAVQAQVQAPEQPAPTPRLGLKPSYSLNAGAMFAGRYGSATYLSPTVSVPVTNRFSVFGGVTYMRVTPGAAYLPFGEAGRFGATAQNRYLIQGGGQYALSPRVTLTGSAWKDLTPTSGFQVNPYASFGGNLGSGVNLRADYHITENFSVSGGVRVSNGATAYPGAYSPLYGPGGYW
ncbi:hypothetical protein DNI29_18735 [Hymenobacter sediminis]|uniref:hypothetical protein n=1 Tax=Hymenobacter sediminis TaxID=2218621 RepID=UPI000F5069DB|nr:hypothetical protein [Hymenobacter sediminis]RPD45419.1 hypothetical protein DNI29_18735 [Hymenobacter sediminis]